MCIPGILCMGYYLWDQQKKLMGLSWLSWLNLSTNSAMDSIHSTSDSTHWSKQVFQLPLLNFHQLSMIRNLKEAYTSIYLSPWMWIIIWSGIAFTVWKWRSWKEERSWCSLICHRVTERHLKALESSNNNDEITSL